MTTPAARKRKAGVSGYIGPDGAWRPGASTGAGVWDTSKDGLMAWAMGLVAEIAAPDDRTTQQQLLRQAHAARNEPSAMGTWLHDRIEQAIVTGDRPTVFDVELEYPGAGDRWAAALKFLDDFSPDPWGTELTCHHPTLPISGTGDFFGTITGLEGLAVIDWKFAKKTSFNRAIWKHLLQATAIAACTQYEDTDGLLHNMPKHDWVVTVGFHEDATYTVIAYPAGDQRLLDIYVAGVSAVIGGLDLQQQPTPPPLKAGDTPMRPTPAHPQEHQLTTPAAEAHIVQIRERLTAMPDDMRNQIREHHDIGDVEFWETLTAARATRLDADITALEHETEGWGEPSPDAVAVAKVAAAVPGAEVVDVDIVRAGVADVLLSIGKTQAEIEAFIEGHEPWDADKLLALREQVVGLAPVVPIGGDVVTDSGDGGDVGELLGEAKGLLLAALALLDKVQP